MLSDIILEAGFRFSTRQKRQREAGSVTSLSSIKPMNADQYDVTVGQRACGPEWRNKSNYARGRSKPLLGGRPIEGRMVLGCWDEGALDIHRSLVRRKPGYCRRASGACNGVGAGDSLQLWWNLKEGIAHSAWDKLVLLF